MINIIFDVDDTLYNLMEPFARAHEELFADRTDASSDELFMASRSYSDVAFRLSREGKLPKEDEFAYRIQRTYRDVQIPLTREEAGLFEKRYRYYQNFIHVPPLMEQLLTECKERKLTMGVLTNGTEAAQGKKIKNLRLDRWFAPENIFISDVVGVSKPDARIFEFVGLQLDLHPADTWYIGDSFEMDVIGAKSAGWHVIWFNHRKRPMPGGDIRPDFKVTSLHELKEAIEKILRHRQSQK